VSESGALPRESARARQAWADYLALGDGRSLELLVREYQSRTGSVPSKQLSRLKKWSADYGWQDRLKKIADDVAAAAEAAYAARRHEILSTGYSLDHERVALLKDLLEDQVDDFRGNEWVKDVKLAANGEQVQVERYNDEQMRQIRGLLDDIAKEVGGRQQKVDVTSGGQPIKGYIGIDPERV
jgi:hypothetical protein